MSEQEITLEYEKELIDEYLRERKELVRIGEKIYGRADCWNTDPDQFAHETIQKFKKYPLWLQAFNQQNKREEQEYQEFREANPITEERTLGEELLFTIADREAFRLDKHAFEIIKNM